MINKGYSRGGLTIAGLGMTSTFSQRSRGVCWAAATLLVMLPSSFGPFAPNEAFAQASNSQGFDSRRRTSDLLAPANPIAAPSREYVGVPIGGWIVNAQALTGITWDSNVFRANVNGVSDVAGRFRPQIEAVNNNGIHSTTLYGYADALFFGDEDDANSVEGAVGARHVWEVQRDLIVKGGFGYTRTKDINNSGTVLTANGLQTIATPIESNSYAGSLSVEKHFGPFFVGGQSNVSYSDYLDIEDSLGRVTDQDERDTTLYSFTGRAGLWVSPVFYTFIQGTQGWQDYRSVQLDSNSQRVIGGIGTDRISLFQGEIYAGYNRRNYDSAGVADTDGVVYGAQVFWYPTRDLTFGLNADRSLGESTLRTAGNPNGSPIETTGVELTVDYLLADIWTLSGKAGYSFTDYTIGTREDEQWSGGLLVSYFVRRNIATTFEWTHDTVDSNISVNSYDRDTFTAGATYKY